MKKKITYFIAVIFLLCLSYLVTMCDFAKGVRNSTRDNIELHKNFMKSFSVNGVILDKKICPDCKENKYQLIAELDDFNIKDIEFGNRVFPPYYTITSNKLNLSVNQTIYDNVSIGDSIIKNKNSDELKIGVRNFLFLNKSKYVWLPTP